MSSFFAFLDDIAVLAGGRSQHRRYCRPGAGKAASKCAAVVHRRCRGYAPVRARHLPARELPVVGAIASARSSARHYHRCDNDLAIAPRVFLGPHRRRMLSLAYEGAEKIIHRLRHRSEAAAAQDVVERSPKDERSSRSGCRDDRLRALGRDHAHFGRRPESRALVDASPLMLIVVIYDFWSTVGRPSHQDRRRRALDCRTGVERTSSFCKHSESTRQAHAEGVCALDGGGRCRHACGSAVHLLIVNLAGVGLPLFAAIVRPHGPDRPGVLLWCADSLISACFGIVVGAARRRISSPRKPEAPPPESESA